MSALTPLASLNVTLSSDTENYIGFNSTFNSSLQNGTVNASSDVTNVDIPPFQSPPLTLTELFTIPIYAIVFIMSVVGNTLVVVTLIQNKRMRTVTNVFLLNLSVSDLLLAVFCMPFTIIPVMLKNYIFGPTVCVLICYMQAVSVCVSCFTLVSISLERYFAICRPLHSRKWQTLSHSYKVIAICWTLAFLLCIPIAVYTKYTRLRRGNGKCQEIWPNVTWQNVYTVVLDVILLVLPVGIMSGAYGKISYTLWSGMKMDKEEMEAENGGGMHRHMEESRHQSCRDGYGHSIGPSEMGELNRNKSSAKTSTKIRFNARGMRQSNSEKSRAAKQRVIKMLLAVVLEFFICWTPLYIIHTWISLDYGHAVQHLSQTTLNIAFVLSYISSCCNPVTYCFMNKNFRNAFLSLCRCCNRKKVVRCRTDMPSYSSARTGISHISTYDKVKEESDEM